MQPKEMQQQKQQRKKLEQIREMRNWIYQKKNQINKKPGETKSDRIEHVNERENIY